MKLDDIGKAMRDALCNSSALISKCAEIYDKDPTVFYGSRGAKSPTDEEAPLFVIFPERKTHSETEPAREFTFHLGCSVLQEAVTDTTINGIRSVEYQGSEDIEDLLDLALDAVLGISPNLTWAVVDYQIETIELFPLFVGEILITVTIPQLIGGYELSL